MNGNCDEASFGNCGTRDSDSAGTHWVLPLLGSLVRREIFEGASYEKTEWMCEMLRDMERGSKGPKVVAVPQIDIR